MLPPLLVSAVAAALGGDGGGRPRPVDRVVGRWSAPPAKVPSDSVVDGPLIGNGRFAGVLGCDTGGPGDGPSCPAPPCKPSRGEIRTFLGMNDFYAAPTNGFSSCGCE
jgi:hypothetical protein